MKLHILCGIPGSGKSTLVQRLSGFPVATDNIRKFLWQDESVVKHDKLVFKLAENIITYMLSQQADVVFDATNLTVARRRRLIKLAAASGAAAVLHWVDCPLETAVERNLKRDRKVPVPIIEALYKSFKKPDIAEGFAIIKIYNQGLKPVKIITPDKVVKRQT